MRAFRRDRRDVAVVLALCIFGIDLFTPLGVASGVPYASVILLTLSKSQPRFTVTMAIVCSIFTILDLFFSVGPGSTEYWKVLVNRALALFAIWVTTTLGVQRNRAAEEARRHLDELARVQRDQSVEQLATAVAHELNQPLAACSLQAELALAALPTDASSVEVRSLLNEVVEQSQRASSILRTLREMVRRQSGTRIALDPNSLVTAVQTWFEPTARQHGISLVTAMAQHLPLVEVNRVQLEQVLINLLQNACDALFAGNCVERTITLSTQVSGQGVKIFVSDTGPGVPLDLKEKLFERFYTTKATGMGIGLAMSRTIVESHGGKLCLEPSIRPVGLTGATFSVELPSCSM